MMITPLMRDYKREKVVNIRGFGFGKHRGRD